jgi:hypothetical protein
VKPLDKPALKTAFKRRSPADYQIPDLGQVDWGVLDYFGWIHPAGHAGYVVMPIANELRGVVLKRMVQANGKPRTHMCSWCKHVYRSRGTAMFSTQVEGTDGRRFIGNYICLNLDCSLRIRNLASDPPTYLPETINLDEKIHRLRISVSSFMARANVLSDLL